ncbi:MAG: ABC transporter permease [Acidimicrobiia bacterium]
MSTPAVIRVVEREARVFARLWRGMVFSTVVSPVLFLAAMGLGLGGLVKAHTGKVAGLSYLDFVAPGLMVASAMQIAANEAMWPVLGAVKWVKNFHATVATSISPGELAVGYLLWIVIRAIGASTVFLLVAALLGAVPSWWGLLAIPTAALCAAAFAAPLAAYSVGLDSDISFPVIMRVAVLPLFLFSGTFFPISQLPGWLRPLAALSPLWHGVQLARDATTGTLHVGADVVHVAVLVGCVAAGLVWARRTFTRRLTS